MLRVALVDHVPSLPRRPAGSRQVAFAVKSPVFMRVRGNVPHFTFDLSNPNVNGYSWVSTGFLRFFWGFVPIGAIFWGFSGKSGYGAARMSTDSGANESQRSQNVGHPAVSRDWHGGDTVGVSTGLKLRC